MIRTSLAVAALLAAPLAAQPMDLQQTLGPGDGPERLGSEFGAAVAVSEAVLAVGAPLQPEAARDAGALYLYDPGPTGWVEAARLVVPEAALFLGSAVAIGPGFVAAGAPGANAVAGAVFVARRRDGAWAVTDRLDGTERNARLGQSLDADGDRIAAGGEASTRVYRHDGDAWVVEADLPTGGAVALAGDLLAVGDFRRPVDGQAEAGAVEVYRRGAAGWALETTLVAPTLSRAQFGYALAFDGERLVVGAPSEDAFAGAAYVFEADGAGVWTAGARLVALDRVAEQLFGHSLAMSGDRLLVGAPNDPRGGGHSGRAYVFDRFVLDGESRWEAAADLAPDPPRGEFFGGGVGLLGSRVVVGVPRAGAPDASRGAVRLYVVPVPVAAAAGPAAMRVTAAPNPTAGPLRLRLDLPAPASVRVDVVDVRGRRVATLDRALGGGPQTLDVDLGGVPAGVYLWRVSGDGLRATGRVAVVR